MPPKIQRRPVTLLIALIISGPLAAQEAGSEPPEKDALYNYIIQETGPDQVLYHGTQYYERYVGIKGNPYFPEDHFYDSNISIHGTTYRDLSLKYDCYGRKLILGYTDLQQRYNQICLDISQIDSFCLGNLTFRKCILPGRGPVFCRVTKKGEVTGFLLWRKESWTISFDNRYTHEFTDPIAECWLDIHGEIFPVAGKKSFISIIPGPLRPEAREFLRTHHISLRQPDYEALSDITGFVADRIEKTGTE